jgi:hypothetical protein
MKAFNPTVISLSEPWTNNAVIHQYQSVNAIAAPINGPEARTKLNAALLVHQDTPVTVLSKRINYISVTTSTFPFNRLTLIVSLYLSPVKDAYNSQLN